MPKIIYKGVRRDDNWVQLVLEPWADLLGPDTVVTVTPKSIRVDKVRGSSYNTIVPTGGDVGSDSP